MGSPLRLAILHDASSTDAWTCVVDEFEAAEAALSRFRETSELTRLNRLAGSGQPMVMSHRLRTALVAAERARRITAGRFDPRVLDQLEAIGYQGAPIPEARGPTGDVVGRGPAVRPVGRAALIVEDRIDLGGIGKGLALRWAAAQLERRGVDTFLLEAGGDLVSRGLPPDADTWIVAIEDPFGGPEPVAAIACDVRRPAVATSSVRLHQWTIHGRTVHHLLDPATGEPGGTGLRSVTIAGSDPAWAEVWSKALFLAGARDIAGEARARGIAAWWIDGSGSLAMTPAARAMTAWVAAEV